MDPSVVYRALREMEVEGWVASDWNAQKTQGPPRRVYRLTEEGEHVLDRWAGDLEESKARVERFLRAYRRMRDGADGKE
jgi:DNA-binding PadR family transcriptional regulator